MKFAHWICICGVRYPTKDSASTTASASQRATRPRGRRRTGLTVVPVLLEWFVDICVTLSGNSRQAAAGLASGCSLMGRQNTAATTARAMPVHQTIV